MMGRGKVGCVGNKQAWAESMLLKWFKNLMAGRWLWRLPLEDAHSAMAWKQLLAHRQWQAAAEFVLQTPKSKATAELRQMRANELLQRFLHEGWAELAVDTALGWLRQVDQLNAKGFKSGRLEEFRGVADLVWEAGRASGRLDFQKALKLVQQAMEAAPKGEMELKKRLTGMIQQVELQRLGNTVECHDNPEDHRNITKRDKSQIVDQPEMMAVDFWIETEPDGKYLATLRDCLMIDGSLIRANEGSLNFNGFQIELMRDEEGCWVMEVKAGEVRVRENAIRRTALMDGAEMKIGSDLKAVFHQPVMESGSGRLIFTGIDGEIRLNLLLLGQIFTIGGPGRPDLPQHGTDLVATLIKSGRQLVVRHKSPETGAFEEIPMKIPSRLSIGNQLISIKYAAAFDTPAKNNGE